MSISSRINLNIRVELEKIIFSIILKDQDEGTISHEVKASCLRDIFGNIALVGASESTDFPDIIIRSTEFKLSEEKTFILEYNLSHITMALKLLTATSTNPALSGKTLRQLCIPFAEDAKMFLREIFNEKGEVSNLAQTLPKLTAKAPWVAFDFNRGLNFKKMSPDEKAVIQNLNRRLLNTQSKLSVTEATTSAVEGEIVA